MTKFVAYFQVSTVCQGQSGLGLEAQQAAVQNFLRGDAHLIATFLEIESGKKNERPQLAAAIAQARQEGAVLLVAKLDRLARNVAFLATLIESRVRFQAVDLPAADEFTLHIMAAVAQKETSAISTRTHNRPAQVTSARTSWADVKRAKVVANGWWLAGRGHAPTAT